MYEFDCEGIQGVPVIISSNPDCKGIIPKKTTGMDYHAQHHGDCPDEVQTVVSLLILDNQNLNELETLIL